VTRGPGVNIRTAFDIQLEDQGPGEGTQEEGQGHMKTILFYTPQKVQLHSICPPPPKKSPTAQNVA